MYPAISILQSCMHSCYCCVINVTEHKTNNVLRDLKANFYPPFCKADESRYRLRKIFQPLNDPVLTSLALVNAPDMIKKFLIAFFVGLLLLSFNTFSQQQ